MTDRHVITLRCPFCERTDHWGGYADKVLMCTCGWYGRPNETEIEMCKVTTLLEAMQFTARDEDEAMERINRLPHRVWPETEDGE